jgi:hypothetical protein
MKISGRGWRKSLLRICIGVLLGIAPIIFLLKTCGDVEIRSGRSAVREWCRLGENIYEVKPARALFCQVTIRKDGRVYFRTYWS